MGDHFVLMVDRLLTESTLDAAIRSAHHHRIGKPAEAPFAGKVAVQVGGGDSVRWQRTVDISCCHPDAEWHGKDTAGKTAECRICQEEDEQGSMESPCNCCGSLKYAHRKCVQRWCNEKGDTVCEICLQQFRPGYTAPIRRAFFRPVQFSVPSGGVWEESGREDYRNHPVIAMLATDHNSFTRTNSYSDGDYDDYVSSSTRSTIYFRLVAVIFLLLLVLRHALPIILSGDDYSITIFSLVLLRVAGIVVPVYYMAQALSVGRRRRQQ